MPSAKPFTKLVTKTLVKGSGPAIAKGQTVVVQYVGRDLEVRDGVRRLLEAGPAVRLHRSPASPSQVIPGWDSGLVGQNVGSRVMLVIPPADGYGKSGNSAGGDQADATPSSSWWTSSAPSAEPASVPELERLVDGLPGQEGGQQLGQAARVEALGAAENLADLPPAGVDVDLQLVRGPAVGAGWRGRCPGTRAPTTTSCCRRRSPRERQVESRRQDGGPSAAASSSSPVSSRTSRTAASA